MLPHRRGDRQLARRAGQRRGWTTGVFALYGEPTVQRSKTFVATWRPAGGALRVVLVAEPSGGVAFFCTDPSARVADVLSAVADRFSLEKGQPHYTSSERWCGVRTSGYHRHRSAA